jgi:hypothetical protein
MSPAHGGGSLTALPVIETQANDVSAFIPTNVISITDGQIYLQADLFNAGQRPALNVGISVSRVGGDAQTKAMRQVAGQLRLDLAQYRELAAFAQFASDLDTQTRNQLERGARLTELLKQDKYQPMPLAEQVSVIYAGTQGFLDKVPVARVREWEAGFIRFLKSEEADLLSTIDTQKALDDKLFDRLKAAISTFNHQFGVEADKPAASSGQAAPPAASSRQAAPPAASSGQAAPPPSGGGQGGGGLKPAAPPAAAPTAEPKAPVQAKAETAEAPEKDEPAEPRPSQLNQIRAALADTPEPKPKPAARQPKKKA